MQWETKSILTMIKCTSERGRKYNVGMISIEILIPTPQQQTNRQDESENREIGNIKNQYLEDIRI